MDMTFPAAVIFDMDGTLIETEPIWDEVRRGLAAEAGKQWPDDATHAMMGMSTREWATYLVDTVGLPGTWQEAAKDTIDHMAARYVSRGIPLLPGAVESVRRMAAVAPLAVASSSPRQLIDTVIPELGLSDVFVVTVSTEEVERGKPAPDGYLRAAELLGVDPAACVAIEDSTNGIKSAHAAGMAVVAVPPAFHPPADDVLALAAAVIPDLDALTPELVRGLR